MTEAAVRCNTQCARAFSTFLRSLIRAMAQLGWGWTLGILGVCCVGTLLWWFKDVISDWLDM